MGCLYRTAERKGVMRKRVLSIALAASMVFSLFTGVSLPVKTYAADAKSSSNLRDIDENTYGELGLSLKVDEDAAPVPYSETNTTKMAAGQEIYVAANGENNNRYTVRDGFDTIDRHNNRSADLKDRYGELDGAYDYYGDVNHSIPTSYGGTTASKISSNRTNSLKNEYNGFSGIYASSVEFDGGDGKENYIAELRAHGKSATTTYNGKTYKGKLTLNIFKIDESGNRTEVAEYSPGLSDSSFSANGNMAYFARRYVQELEVIFDIEKGDVNGDGLDDLFLYTGRYTDISDIRYAIIDVFYGDGNGRFTRGDDVKQGCGSSADFPSSDKWYEWMFGIPTASLAAGDLDRDGKDELAVTVSTSTEHKNVAAAGHLSVFYCVNNNMAYVEGLQDIPLANPGVEGRGMAAANCTFGDFVMPDSDLAVTTLVVGGYYEGTYMNKYTPFSDGAYFYIYKNLRGKGYRISDYHVVDLGRNSCLITESYKNNQGYNNRPVHAPISMACADLDGMANGKPGDSILFGAEVYDFTIRDGLGDQIGEISLCTEQYNKTRSQLVYENKSQVWIGDVKVGSVDTNASDYNYRESFVCVVGVRNGEENYNTSKDYYWMDIAIFTLVNGKAYSSQEGVIAISNPRNDQYGTFISFSLPDIDNDAVIMEFDEKYVVYTNPEVYAVLEASPYFADLQEAYGYVNNGGTSYSTSTGSSSSTSTGFSQTVGVYTSAEASFFGSAEFEAEVAFGASYEYETTRTTEYEISYNAAGGGTDQVVMFCLKYMYYVYNIYIPEEKEWEKLIMPVSLGSSTSILDVEDYDRIAEKTRGLSPVRDNILYNTPGYPETYSGAVYGSSAYTFPGSYSGVAASQGADQTQTITVTTEESSTLSFNLEINVKAGAGGGFLGNNAKAGVTSHTEAGFGTTTSSSEGMSFSGTVDNVPRDCSDYTFDWKLIVNTARLNSSGNPVWVIGYDVRGVERPPYMPMGLTVTDATKNSISLTWDSVEQVSFYELYILDAKGNYNLKATVPYTVTDYTVKGLVPNRTYSFAVRSVDSLGAKSIHSPSATASTLQDSANFKITKHPEDASTYSGGTVEFSAGASYEDEAGISRSVGYCWQVHEDGEWKNVKRGGTVATLKLIGVSDDMDGFEYRCRVYYNDITLYTKAATLSVNKAVSVSGLSLCYDDSGKVINDKDIVHATGGVETTHQETVYEVNPVIVYSADNTFVLVTDGTNYLWEDSDGNYYECTATISVDEDGTISEGTTFDASSIGSSTLSISESGYTSVVTSVTSDDSGSSELTKTTYTLVSSEIAAGETVSYTSGSNVYNVIKKKWVDSENTHTFYQLATSDDSDSVFYYVNSKDAAKCGECSINNSYSITLGDGTTVKKSSLKDAMLKSSSEVTVADDDTLYNGATVRLSCKPTSLSGEAINGPVKFSVSGPNYELLTGTYDSATGSYVATWTPKGEGTYNIYSIFEGNELYNSSNSETMTVYTILGDRKSICLDVDSEASYGDEVDFVLSEINGADGKTTDITEANGVSYTVYKYNTAKRLFEEAASNAYTISGSVFIPKETGNFKLKADRSGSTVEEVIYVSMAKLIISAVDTEKGINDADRSCENAVITGIKSWDRQYTPVRDVDYELQSDGEASNILGEYVINSAIIRNSDNSYTDNIAYLSERYNLGMQSAQYTLTGKVYTVTAKTANTHGSVSINYKQNKDDVNDGLEVESGMKLPEKSQIILYATPAKGYKVKNWTINGKTVTNAQGSTAGNGTYSDTQVEIESLGEDVAAVVNFEPVYHSLTYISDNAEYGTVSANYITDGEKGNAFGSGGNIHIEQTVRIEAQPKAGYTLDHWTVTGEDGVEKTVLAEDEVTEYTALFYDAKEISENTIVTAYFAETNDFSLSVSPVVVGSDGQPTVASGVEVSVKADRAGQIITIDKGSNGRYDVKKGDNITVEVTVPSGFLIDGWSAADGQTVGTVSADLKKMSIYNVTSDLDYTVTYTAPNRYKLVFIPDKDEAGSVNAVVSGSSDALTSGDKQLQGTDIEFTAKPNKGYEIANWEVNGEIVEAEKNSDGSEKYVLNYLGKDTKVVVNYYKQPIITWTSGNSTVVTAKAGQQDITNGTCIAYASSDSLVFTTTVKKGYEIDDVVVTYDGAVAYKLSAADMDSDDKFVETVDGEETEKYTFTWPAPEGGFTGNVNVAFKYKTIVPVVSCEYLLDIIEKDQTNPSNGKMHGEIAATVDRKGLSAYAQTGDTVSDSTAEKSATISGIYRDSVITFTVTPDSGYNVKEWLIDGEVVSSQSETVNVSTAKKTNDTLKLTIDKTAMNVSVMARLELVGDVLTFGPDIDATGDVSAVMTPSGIKLESGDMIGSPANVTFIAAPADGYVVADWKINGILQGTTEKELIYKVPTGVRTDVRAVFDNPEYNITWSVDGAGSLSASNTTESIDFTGTEAKVRGGRTLVFTASPDQYMECTGYTVVTPNGTKEYTAEELGGDVLTIDAVSSDMNVTAHFAKKEIKITINFGANDDTLGTVTAKYGIDKKSNINSGDSLDAGGDVEFTAVPADGQMIEGWYTDPECTNKIEGTQLEQTSYSANTLYDDMSVYVKFVEIPSYKVQVGLAGTGTAKLAAARAGENIDIVDGEIAVKRHEGATITVTPEDIYNTVEYWLVNGEKVESSELSYTLTDVTEDMSVFAYVSPTLVVDVLFVDTDTTPKYDNIDIKVGYVGEDGDTSGFTSINAVNNNVRIGSGKDVSFDITPSDDYMIGTWTVNYIRGGKVIKTETGADFGFTNSILLEDVTSNIEVYANLVDKVGFYIPEEGSYSSDGILTVAEDEAAYTISDMYVAPDNVLFTDENGQPVSNIVRKNGDAGVVVAPADGWRIRSVSPVVDDTADPASAADSIYYDSDDAENVYTIEEVFEDGIQTGAYRISVSNVTKDVAFVVDAVRVYPVNILESDHGSIKATLEDGSEIKSGDIVDEGTVITFTAEPDIYYDFDCWTEDVAEQTETQFELTVSKAITVGAAFKPRYAKVNIATVQNGKITVKTAQGKVVTNGSLVQEGTTIICTATPAAHCDLSAWGADAKGKTGTKIKLLVTKEMKISASFKFRYVKVTINKPVNGQISVKTVDGKVLTSGVKIKEGTVLICTAKAAKGCKLKGWTGSITGAQATKKFAANKDITVGAKFIAQIPSQNTAGINRNIRAKYYGGAIKIAWGKVNNADGYDVYMQPCYKSPDYITCVKTVKGSSNVTTTISKMGRNPLSKYDIVKIRVKAYKYSGGKKTYIQTSTMFHIVINSKTYTNIKTVTVPKSAYVLNVNQTVSVKPSVSKAAQSKKLIGTDHGAKIVYCSTNTNVATVDAYGRVKAKASGKCIIYVISISGVTQQVQITVN